MKGHFNSPLENTQNIEVIIGDLKNNPKCPHGPTLLFSRRTKNETRQFFACAACRDRKMCNFFLWADEKENILKKKAALWENECIKYTKGVNHRKLFLALNKIKGLHPSKRIFCDTCCMLISDESGHTSHSLVKNVSDYQLEHPSEILKPLDNPKKEAQYLFSKQSTKSIVQFFKDLKYKNVICIGTPRIHEYISSECNDITSILLDIDSRFHTFFGPLQFCWFNSFNNYFFFKEGQQVFNDFLKSTNGENTVLITDPPFGGRIEPLVRTFKTISKNYANINGNHNVLPVFWIFPYFMEAQLLNYMPELHMLDYKVEYDNHLLFQNGPKGRKQGSPVRIFTTVDAKLIKLPSNLYKFCKFCCKWVSKENKHCKICKACTSKNGETYVHCLECQRCVKPNWKHCNACKRCTQPEHICMNISFNGSCFQCKEIGHRRNDCPQLMSQNHKKRKRNNAASGTKKKKIA
ncbi:hypothetical protein GWI33_013841 [Rhynchophorus ferrugineus]|uniref:rRNA N(6)-adenosine-methyltransferase ZCCHC4 n=1 Tax=Rhynchophorus ferrugineus TaxID=354439 RepID=A0A834MCW4_RHYFE|nr:hypothetical protein GWI33_013841 [Rhynchophorus ferrugineus]